MYFFFVFRIYILPIPVKLNTRRCFDKVSINVSSVESNAKAIGSVERSVECSLNSACRFCWRSKSINISLSMSRSMDRVLYCNLGLNIIFSFFHVIY